MSLTRTEVVNIISRAAWTFIQAAIGIVAVAFAAGENIDTTLIYSAAAAGIAAAASLIKSWWLTRTGSLTYTDMAPWTEAVDYRYQRLEQTVDGDPQDHRPANE